MVSLGFALSFLGLCECYGGVAGVVGMEES